MEHVGRHGEHSGNVFPRELLCQVHGVELSRDVSALPMKVMGTADRVRIALVRRPCCGLAGRLELVDRLDG